MALGSEVRDDQASVSKVEEAIASSDGPTTTESAPFVDDATEKRILTKLDRRIIPCVCWIYLMNFMDRGESDPAKANPR